MSLAGAPSDVPSSPPPPHVSIAGLAIPGVVDSFDLRLADGEAVALIGPSAAGNTRLLRALAGLDPCTASITMARSDDSAAVQTRPVAMVFRDLALYPHLDVAGNITFPLRHGWSSRTNRHDMRQRLDDVARQLELTGLLELLPGELSRTQQLRVAVARAIACRPSLLLFDDALAELPSVERLELRAALRRLQQSSQLTSIYATTDSADSMALADRVAVIAGGRLHQLDTPANLYDHPATLAVARLLGAPPVNLIEARLEGRILHVGDQRIEVSRAEATRRADVVVGIRPEAFALDPAGENRLLAVLDPGSRETLGSQTVFHGRVGDEHVRVCVPGNPGDVPRRASVAADRLLLFDRHSGNRLD